MLRPVAVGAHPTDDQDALQTVALLHVSCSDRDVIEEAEAHGPPGFGMVPQDAPHKNMLHLTGQNRIHSSQCPTGGKIGSRQGAGDMEVSAFSDTPPTARGLLRARDVAWGAPVTHSSSVLRGF